MCGGDFIEVYGDPSQVGMTYHLSNLFAYPCPCALYLVQVTECISECKILNLAAIYLVLNYRFVLFIYWPPVKVATNLIS